MLLAPATVAAMALSGCGYTTSTALLPTHIKTLAIPVFENATTEYNLEQELTAAVIQRFVADNHVKIVAERDANAVLRGRITDYRNSVFGFATGNHAQEYRVSITVSVVFKDIVKNREIWNDQALVRTANYYVEPVPGDTAKTELDGRKNAIAKIADEILSRSVEGW